MEFTGEIARLQQRLAECQELSLRRYAVVEQLAPRRGERVLEIGCGAGLLLREIGQPAIPALTEVAENYPRKEVRDRAARALRQLR